MPQWVDLGGAYLLKGSPGTLVVPGDPPVVVDPGHGRKRVKQLRRLLEEAAGGRDPVVVLTHHHSDHLALLYQGFEPPLVLAPQLDLPMVWDPLERTRATFGIPMDSGPLLLFDARGVPGARPLEEYKGGLPVEPLATPGHTAGHTAYIAEGGIVYAGDSLFGPRVLDNYAVPYHAYPCRALESLDKLAGLAGDHTLVPGHGPPARGRDAEELVEANRRRIMEAKRLVEEALREPRTPGSLAVELAKRYARDPGRPGLLLLVETAVRGYLGCMADRLEAIVTGEGVAYRLSPR